MFSTHPRAPLLILANRSQKMICSRSIFLKDQRDRFAIFDLFQRLTRSICSRSIFLKDQREQFDHGRPFLKIEKMKDRRSKIERSKDLIPNPVFTGIFSKRYNRYILCQRGIANVIPLWYSRYYSMTVV